MRYMKSVQINKVILIYPRLIELQPTSILTHCNNLFISIKSKSLSIRRSMGRILVDVVLKWIKPRMQEQRTRKGFRKLIKMGGLTAMQTTASIYFSRRKSGRGSHRLMC